MSTKTIIFTPQAEHLAKYFKSKKYKIILFQNHSSGKRIFPDQEIYFRIEKPKSKKVILIHSGHFNPNQGLIYLYSALEFLKQEKIKVHLIFTNFAYARQDGIWQEGEINMAQKIIEKILNYYQVPKITILEPHFKDKLWAVKLAEKNKIKIINALDLIKKMSKFKKLEIWGTDLGVQLRSGIPSLLKIRIKGSPKTTVPDYLKKKIKGKNILIYDDIISTGKTIINAYQLFKKFKAKKIQAFVVHGTSLKGIEKVKRYFQKNKSKLYLTNSCNLKEANINIAPWIEKYL